MGGRKCRVADIRIDEFQQEGAANRPNRGCPSRKFKANFRGQDAGASASYQVRTRPTSTWTKPEEG